MPTPAKSPRLGDRWRSYAADVTGIQFHRPTFGEGRQPFFWPTRPWQACSPVAAQPAQPKPSSETIYRIDGLRTTLAASNKAVLARVSYFCDPPNLINLARLVSTDVRPR